MSSTCNNSSAQPSSGCENCLQEYICQDCGKYYCKKCEASDSENYGACPGCGSTKRTTSEHLIDVSSKQPPMKKYKNTSLFISILAILISIASAVYSGLLNQRLASSDYQAQEQVKADTTKLISALRSLMHKGALSSTTNETIDISSEKKVINDFLCSQTGFAFYSWVSEKSAEAQSKGKRGESWRLFFLYLAELSNANNAYSAARRAADVELLFDDLTEEDIFKITEFNSNLVKAIAQNSKNRDGNVVVKALVESQRDLAKQRNHDNFLKKLNYLKSIGIKDPNIDMFLAVLGDDVSKLEAALAAGADVHMTDGALLAKYVKELRDYK